MGLDTMKKHALISVTDKTGVVEFAKKLIELDYTVLSTGGTSKILKEAGVTVTDVADFTSSPEILGGRVKTLHPKVHGGILFDRSHPEQIADAERLNIMPIDLVVVNLYQFQKNAVSEGLTLEKAIEFIDIGGPTMLRAAAKNWMHCLPVMNPEDYTKIASALKSGDVSRDIRTELARKTFAAISKYDQAITNYFEAAATAPLNQESDPEKSPVDIPDLPQSVRLNLEMVQTLRYGENPHQKACLYRPTGSTEGFADLQVLQGKEVSYNNLIDLDAACAVVLDFPEATAVSIIKHTNPCGAAMSKTNSLESVYREALTGDPKSAFGGIVATNKPIDEATAKAMSEIFIECIAAPDYSKEALAVFAKKKNLRIVKAKWLRDPVKNAVLYRAIQGGLLAQTSDVSNIKSDSWKCVTESQPTETEWNDLAFAMTLAKHIKSNAIVYAKDLKTITVGAGQMSRIDSANFAAQKAKEEDKELKGSVLASDAFFPFRDCVDLAAKFGIRCIVQPGGSIRDQESIDAANEAGIAMVFSGERHFRH